MILRIALIVLISKIVKHRVAQLLKKSIENYWYKKCKHSRINTILLNMVSLEIGQICDFN